MYTKEYFRQQLSDIISPIKKYYNGGKVQYARHSALFTALSAIGAFIRIPVPLVPFTLQITFSTLAGLLLL